MLTAANGDEMESSAVGLTSPPDAAGNVTFCGDWKVTGGSGRFKNGTGSGTFDGGGNFFTGVAHIIFEGEISRPKGRNPVNL